MLLLNKKDLLREKIVTRGEKLEDHFPEFASYRLSNLPSDEEEEEEEEEEEVEEVGRALSFMRDSFCAAVSKAYKNHSCYVFYTNALDVKNIETVFKSYSIVYETSVLRHYELL